VGKERKRQDSADGLFGKLLRPWKTQRVTLTKTGKKRAPLKKGRKPKKPAEAAQSKTAPATPREKTVKEIQMLLAIGKRDPQRLASIVSRMLASAQEQEEQARLRFEQLVWDKAESKGDEQDQAE